MKRKKTVYPLLREIRRYFLDGLAVILPLTVTVLLLVWVFKMVDSILQPIIEAVYGRTLIGLGFVAIMELILLAGILVNSGFGKKLLRGFDFLLGHIPIFAPIYSATKSIAESVVSSGITKKAFKKVVFIEWPAKGMKTIAFVTNEQFNSRGQRIYSIYIPTSPTPQTGFYMVAHEGQIYPSDLTVEQAMKMVISAGIISPEMMEIDGLEMAASIENDKRGSNERVKDDYNQKPEPLDSLQETNQKLSDRSL